LEKPRGVVVAWLQSPGWGMGLLSLVPKGISEFFQRFFIDFKDISLR